MHELDRLGPALAEPQTRSSSTAADALYSRRRPSPGPCFACMRAHMCARSRMQTGIPARRPSPGSCAAYVHARTHARMHARTHAHAQVHQVDGLAQVYKQHAYARGVHTHAHTLTQVHRVDGLAQVRVQHTRSTRAQPRTHVHTHSQARLVLVYARARLLAACLSN